MTTDKQDTGTLLQPVNSVSTEPKFTQEYQVKISFLMINWGLMLPGICFTNMD